MGEVRPRIEDRSRPPAGAGLPGAAAHAQIAALFREHFRFLWRSLRRLGVREASVDDAVQDVFLVAHRKLAEFEGRSTHRVWLFAIALRVAAEHRRRDARLQLDDHADETPAREQDGLEQRRRMRLLYRLLDELSDPQREVFVMAEIEGFTAPEIAEALDEKLNTVYSRLRLARRHFERALARQKLETVEVSR
jgi:RNA polymerase sigma-70 factor, ECF subfamily